MAFLKSFWRGNSSKHKKLCEEWALASREALAGDGSMGDEGDGARSFVVKYLGSTPVEAAASEAATAEAVRAVIRLAKAKGRPPTRVALTVSLSGIRALDASSLQPLVDVSIYRISYCSADATYDHVFAFIATNANDTMECHAFLCPKRKTAQAVTLTVAQSFNTAYELWQMAEGRSGENGKKMKLLNETDEQTENLRNRKVPESDGSPVKKNMSESKSLLIDLSESSETHHDNGNSWVCFDDDRSENINSSLSRMTVSAMSPQHHLSVLTSGSHNSSNSSNSTSNSSTNVHPWGEAQPVNLLCS